MNLLLRLCDCECATAGANENNIIECSFPQHRHVMMVDRRRIKIIIILVVCLFRTRNCSIFEINTTADKWQCAATVIHDAGQSDGINLFVHTSWTYLFRRSGFGDNFCCCCCCCCNCLNFHSPWCTVFLPAPDTSDNIVIFLFGALYIHKQRIQHSHNKFDMSIYR